MGNCPSLPVTANLIKVVGTYQGLDDEHIPGTDWPSSVQVEAAYYYCIEEEYHSDTADCTSQNPWISRSCVLLAASELSAYLGCHDQSWWECDWENNPECDPEGAGWWYHESIKRTLVDGPFDYDSTAYGHPEPPSEFCRTEDFVEWTDCSTACEE